MTMPLFFSDAGEVIPIIAVSGSIIVAILWTLASFIKGLHRQSKMAQVQREIAAYVAEGSITPQDGERMMKAALDVKPDPEG
jgi:hypothetical protein